MGVVPCPTAYLGPKGVLCRHRSTHAHMHTNTHPQPATHQPTHTLTHTHTAFLLRPVLLACCVVEHTHTDTQNCPLTPKAKQLAFVSPLASLRLHALHFGFGFALPPPFPFARHGPSLEGPCRGNPLVFPWQSDIEQKDTKVERRGNLLIYIYTPPPLVTFLV